MKGGRSKAETKRTDATLKRKGAASERAGKRAAPKKAAKDPQKPKRPASAFFVFMEEFRQEYKAKHPNNKSVAAVSKAAGEKWKSMSEEDKAPYVEKAEKRKSDYDKSMQVYNKKMAEGPDDAEDESDKSKSEVNDDEEDDEEESEEDEDDD